MGGVCLYWPNKPPICRERRTVDAGSGGSYSTPYLHPFQTHRQIPSPAQRFFDACRYRCVMMSYVRERGREAWSKERGRDEDAGDDIQDNNGTKMATASAMGRPVVSRPPDHQEEPWRRVELIHPPHSNRMTTSYWNHQANHHDRRARTVSSPSTFPLLSLKPSNPQRPDVWSLHPKHLSWVATLSNNTFFFFQPFHHGLLAVNIGLSLPSKAAHQLPWLPSVCVRVKERKGEEKKEKHHVSKIKARFHAWFWPCLGFAFHHLSIRLLLAVRGLQTRAEPAHSPTLSGPQSPSLKNEISRFYGENGCKYILFLFFSLRIFCSLQATGPELCPDDDNTWNNIWISSRRAAS